MSYPDRIDFDKMHDGRVIVVKMRRNGRRSIPAQHETKATDFDLDAALDWCRENGYTVHNWHYGARAWKGEAPWPVRTMRQIIEYREKLEETERYYFRKLYGGDALKEDTSQIREMWNKFSALLKLDLAFDG